MVVSFTPNIGLAKPDNFELAANWINGTELQEDNNLIIIDKMDVNFVSYTPVIGAQTTAPNLGTGVIKGEYQEIQGFVIGSFVVPFLDAGITAGAGEYGISLPFLVDSSFHSVGTSFNTGIGSNSVVGEGYIHDNSTPLQNNGSVVIDVITVTGVSYGRLLTETFVGKNAPVFKDGMPFTVANNDKLTGSFFYKKA